MDPSSSPKPPSASTSRNASSSTSTTEIHSKKRSREAANSDETMTPETKRFKTSSSDSSSTHVSLSPSKTDTQESWEDKCFRILLEQVLQKGVIYVTKCGASKCPASLSEGSSDSQSLSPPENALELESKMLRKCLKSVLAHGIVWHEDVEAKQKDGVAPRIQRLFSMIVCARWMCTYGQSTHNTFQWTYLLLTRLQMEIESFNNVMKAKPDIKPSAVLKTLLSSLSDASTASLAKVAVSCKIASNYLTDHSSIESQETRIGLLCALDNLFYLLYHYSLVSPLSSSSNVSTSTPSTSIQSKTDDISKPKPDAKKKLSIASPVAYFQLFFDPVSEEVHGMISKFWKSEVDRMTRKRMQHCVGSFQSALESSSTNPLLAIWQLRFMEYVRFYYASGLSKSSREMEQAIESQVSGLNGVSRGKKASKIKRVRMLRQYKEHASEPVCSEALQTWRDVSRDWPSLLFAYAVPTPLALDTIAEYGPIVEIGAGTGYWANLLRSRGVKVAAFDSVPTTIAGEQNEFHSNVPPFYDVLKAGTAAVRKYSGDHSLFLCFPPPDDTMALDALRLFTGRYVIHVGEWEGFTGSLDFETQLFQNFALIRRVELPNWQDTCCDLTIWERRRPSNASSSSSTSSATESSTPNKLAPTAASHSVLNSSPLSESHQHLRTVQCSNCGKITAVLRRCRCCRIAAFCSKSCASHGSRQHTSIHALHGIFTTSPIDSLLDYNQTKHYRVLRMKQV